MWAKIKNWLFAPTEIRIRTWSMDEAIRISESGLDPTEVLKLAETIRKYHHGEVSKAEPVKLVKGKEENANRS